MRRNPFLALISNLFSLKPDLVLHDITSTCFEHADPASFANHRHSLDSQPHHVQVIVDVVMVAGWPIAHHVWAGNEVDHETVQRAVHDLHLRLRFHRMVFVTVHGLRVTEV